MAVFGSSGWYSGRWLTSWWSDFFKLLKDLFEGPACLAAVIMLFVVVCQLSEMAKQSKANADWNQRRYTNEMMRELRSKDFRDTLTRLLLAAQAVDGKGRLDCAKVAPLFDSAGKSKFCTFFLAQDVNALSGSFEMVLSMYLHNSCLKDDIRKGSRHAICQFRKAVKRLKNEIQVRSVINFTDDYLKVLEMKCPENKEVNQ